jgi:hypothetical protein
LGDGSPSGSVRFTNLAHDELVVLASRLPATSGRHAACCEFFAPARSANGIILFHKSAAGRHCGKNEGGSMPKLALVTGFALVVLGAAGNITGTWALDARFDDSSLGGDVADCAFKQEGEQLTGNCSGTALKGEVKGQNIDWQLQVGSPPQTTTYSGTVDEAGAHINGTFILAGKSGRFTASKQR